MPISLNPGAEKERFVLMKPLKEDGVYTGDLSPVVSGVEQGVVGGTWYLKGFGAGDEKKSVVLHFHGGSFIFGSGRQAECAAPAALLTNHVADSALFVQYRLAGEPGCSFPAAIQDVVTAYQYLINERGIPASKITISGDSAGGSIAVALLRYLESRKQVKGGKVLPLPAGCALWSPSIDLATQTVDDINNHRNYNTDYLAGFTLVWGIELYIPKTMDITGPWFSPLRHPFATTVPIWVMAGGAEVLVDSIVGFAARMREVEGTRVGLYEIPNAPHDVFIVGHVLGWSKEAGDAARAAGEFFKEQVIKDSEP